MTKISSNQTFGTGGAVFNALKEGMKLQMQLEQSNLQQARACIEINTALGNANQSACIAAGKAQAQSTTWQAINEGIGAAITIGGAGLEKAMNSRSRNGLNDLTSRRDDLMEFQDKLQNTPIKPAPAVAAAGDLSVPGAVPAAPTVLGVEELTITGCPKRINSAPLIAAQKGEYEAQIADMSPAQRKDCLRLTQEEILGLNTNIDTKERSFQGNHSLISQGFVPMLNNVASAFCHTKQAVQQNIQGEMEGLKAQAQSGAGTASNGLNSALQANSAAADMIKSVLRMYLDCQPR